MKKNVLAILFAMCAVLLLMTVSAGRVAAQGPAGSGASTAAQGSSSSSHSSHSLNPIKWVKKDKDSKNSPDSNGTRSDVEKKLTPKLQAQGVLPAKANATDTCASFTLLNDCLAALHASRNLALDFNCLRASVTGVHSTADLEKLKKRGGASNGACPFSFETHDGRGLRNERILREEFALSPRRPLRKQQQGSPQRKLQRRPRMKMHPTAVHRYPKS